MASSEVSQYDANPTFGAFTIGIDISMLLLGVLTLQTYIYFSRYYKDPFWIKAMVALIWCVEVGHAICVAATNYTWMIIHYGNPEVLIGRLPVTLQMSVIFSGVVSPITQSFFAWRFLVLSKRWLIPVVCWILSFIRLLASVLILAETTRMKTFPQYLVQWKWLLIFVFAIGCFIDILVALCLCYYINREKERAMRRTARILSKMMEYAIQTGVITSIAEIMTIILFVKMPDNFIWLSIFTFLPRLFSNSLLASLNAREKLRQQRLPQIGSSVPDFSFHSRAQGDMHGILPPAISVNHETIAASDAVDGHSLTDSETTKALADIIGNRNTAGAVSILPFDGDTGKKRVFGFKSLAPSVASGINAA